MDSSATLIICENNTPDDAWNIHDSVDSAAILKVGEDNLLQPTHEGTWNERLNGPTTLKVAADGTLQHVECTTHWKALQP